MYFRQDGTLSDTDVRCCNVSESKVGLKSTEEAIASHPFAVREIAKQSEDLQRLKQAEKLDRDFVEWLRTSFDNDGKSLIDLG